MQTKSVKNSIKAISITFILFNICILSVSILHANLLIKVSPTQGSMPPDRPAVFIDPQIKTVEIGDTVTFSVKIFNLTDNFIVLDPIRRIMHWLGNLYGLDIQVSWDPTVLKYASHVVKIPVEDFPDGALHAPSIKIKDEVNTTAGTYSIAYSSQSPAPAFNNPNTHATVFEITFKVIGYRSSYITLDFTELAAAFNYQRPEVSTEIHHHPKHPYPGFISDAYLEFPGTPVAKFTIWPVDVAVVNKAIRFDASESHDPDGNITLYIWDFGDGTKTNTTAPIVEHIFTKKGTFLISLKVMDNSTPPLCSAPYTKSLHVVGSREVVVKGYRASDEILLRGLSLFIDVTVRNDGEWDENFTLTAYYNKTEAEWAEITNKSVSLKAKEEKIITLEWDTTVIKPGAEGPYSIMVNITTIIPHENNVTNNFAPRPPEIPPIIVLITAEAIYDIAVESMEIVVFGREARVFSPPVLTGEKITMRVRVARKGTVYEAFNATLQIIHPNGTILDSKVWSLQKLGAGNKSVLLGYDFPTGGLKTGDYNVSVYAVNSGVAQAEADVNKTNNGMSKMVKVVEPPILNFILPETISVGEAVTLDATASKHPGGQITKYKWEIYEGITKRPDLSGEGPIMVVAFDKPGRWRVILQVEDDHGVTYDVNRPISEAYRRELAIDVREAYKPIGEVAPTFPTELILALTVTVVVIAGCLAYLKLRRRKG